MTAYVIMHRAIDTNDVMEPDKLVFISYSKHKADWEFDNFQAEACEHDYYYIVTGEM